MEAEEAALRRIKGFSAAAYAAFSIFTVFSAGFRAFLGLTCAAAVTMISFLWREQYLGALLQPTSRPKSARLTVRALARLLLLGAAILVLIYIARFNAVIVLLGSSIVVVGVIGEAAFSMFKSFTSE
jgi:hypothetical protein